MDTETVDDVPVNIPKDTRGKYTLVGLAYSKKSEDDLNSWFSPVYNKFIYKPEKPTLFSGFGYDVNVYFVPMFTGINAAATGTAKKKAAKNIDPKLLPYILFYKGNIKEYKNALNLGKKDKPYFFVLDEDGKIVFATEGPYTEAKLDAVEEELP